VQFELVRHFLRRCSTVSGPRRQGSGGRRPSALLASSCRREFCWSEKGLLDPKYASKYRLLAMAAGPPECALRPLPTNSRCHAASICVTGLMALLEWESLFPSGRDYLALASLPVHSDRFSPPVRVRVVSFSAAMIVPESLPQPHRAHGIWRSVAHRFVVLAARGRPGGFFRSACFFVSLRFWRCKALSECVPARRFARVSVYVQGALAGSSWPGWALKLVDQKSGTPSHRQTARIRRLASPVWFTGCIRH